MALREVRERAIGALSEHFAADALDVDEFERRVSLAHRAASVAEVDELLEDLPALGEQARPKPTTAMVLAAEVRDRQTLAAILGGVNRQGTWTAPRRLRVVAVMGGSVLDFREARLAPGVSEVHVFILMGGVQIIVPPELAVETSGIAVMGGFEHMERTPLAPDPDRPVLRVSGFALMGGVAIETRLQGEGERDARKRRRRERRQLRLGPGERR